ncbi:MAG: pentapeptide repeat-containing protein [Deltaproteobacteria bacterium]|nr:pentapeptide repeat-containing protein [Deltaproteobacteria bacterium]
MANSKHLAQLKKGVENWNKWREENPAIEPDLSGAGLYRADLHEANLSRAHLSGAFLVSANLAWAHLREAALKADLRGANLSEANCNGAYLSEANLMWANLGGADLTGATLDQTTLVRTQLRANLTGCSIYGISAWDIDLEGAIQLNLRITPEDEPTIQVDNLEVAQFIYLLLNNKSIRDIIDAITSKVVLILGRFTDERKVILDALRDELRNRNYTPVLFDFDKPASRDLTETISTLAHMARFVIADITDAKSIPQELERIVPDLPSVAIQPLLLASQHEYGMFEHFRRYPWVLELYVYQNQAKLLVELGEKVIAPAENKVKEQIHK